MDSCKSIKKYFEKALDNELNEKELEIFNEHLTNCNKCQTEFLELLEVKHFMKDSNTIESNDTFLDNLWDKIEPELILAETKEKPNYFEIIKGFIFNNNRKIIQYSTAFAILFIGIFIGRYYLPEENKNLPITEQNIIADNSQNESIDLDVKPKENIDILKPTSQPNKVTYKTVSDDPAAKFVSRSKILLMGLVNFDPTTDDIDAINMQKQKEISRGLILQAADIKKKLTKPSQQQLKDLINDLEVILLQIANLESEYNLDGIDLVKDGVDKRNIFLKININEMQKTSSPKQKQEYKKSI